MAPGLTKGDRLSVDTNVAGEGGCAAMGSCPDEDAEGEGVGEDENPEAGGGVVDEERGGIQADAIGRIGETDRGAVPVPAPGEPGEGGRSGLGGRGAGGELMDEFAVVGMKAQALITSLI